MTDKPLKILLIEDNPGDARLIREMLGEITGQTFDMEWVGRLSLGLERLAKGDIEIVLLDLSLPDSHGLDTCRAVHSLTKDVVVIVFTGFDDIETGTRAVKEGAQDYLVKGKVDGNLLMRSMSYAMERQRMKKQLEALSIMDELTGLYNRRGLAMTGEELVKMGRRLGKEIFLLFTDLDGMKWINDNLGHQEGDRALQETARICKATFRETDIIARIGGDEFVVLGLCDSAESAALVRDRFFKKLEERNHRQETPYKLSISAGIVSYGPGESVSIDEMLARADALMYEQKKSRRASRGT